jgi:hypothetical protein
MSKLPKAGASRITLDGKFGKLLGFTPSDNRTLDDFPILIQSGVLDLINAVSNQGGFVAPCDLEIVGVWLDKLEAPGTAAALLTVGTFSDPDKYIDDYSIATSSGTGLVDITANAAVVLTTISKGDCVVFSADGGATGTGKCAVTLICRIKQ